MGELFLKLVNLSIGAGWLVLAVVLVRLIFRRAPRWIFCVLWGLVAVRLVCPVSIESVWSMIPSAQTVGLTSVPSEAGKAGETHVVTINTGFRAVDEPVNRYIGERYQEAAAAPADTSYNTADMLGYFWLAGVAALLFYSLVSYVLLRHRMSTATLYRKNIRQSEQVASPFVLGLFRPVIYLPYRIAEADMEHVIAHEQAHIQRKDHWWKPVGFTILSVYWFHPLLWLAYVLLCRDIEAACDEKVIKKLELEERRAYSVALLNCSVHRRRIAACPLAFGETGVKERIKNVMNYKRPAFWMILVTAAAGLAVAICFMTNPKEKQETERENTDSVHASVQVTPSADPVDTGKEPVTPVVYKPVDTSENEKEIEKYVAQYEKMGITKSDLTLVTYSGTRIATGEDVLSISKDAVLIEFTDAFHEAAAARTRSDVRGICAFLGINQKTAVLSIMLRDECILQGSALDDYILYSPRPKNSCFMHQSYFGENAVRSRYKNKLVWKKGDLDDDAGEWKLHAFARVVGIEEEEEILQADANEEICMTEQKYQIDLNGDGVSEVFSYGIKGLIINGCTYPELQQKICYESADTDNFFLWDFDAEDPYKEILIWDHGPSNDEACLVLRYTKTGELMECGYLEGSANYDDWICDGKGRITIWERLDILQTWWGRKTYEIGPENRFSLVPQEEYTVSDTLYDDRYYELKMPIRLYEARDTEAGWTVLQPQKIRFLATDDKYFIRLEAEDGSTGYMLVDAGIIIEDGSGCNSDEVMEGLNHAD